MKARKRPCPVVQAIDQRELADRSFACIEGCGFCCTFQPEASTRELALLRARLKPKPLAVVAGDGRTFLALQNKCGACTLLERRQCTQYDLRPAHCRYFPFHVHFARAPEAYVNYTCRGVETRAGGDLGGAFAQSVLSIAKADDLARHDAEARAAYATFERQAKRAGAWGEVAPIVEEALAGDPFERAWMERAIERADEGVSVEDMLHDALLPFSADDITKRPFYLTPDVRWITFDGPTRAVEMDEKGDLHTWREIPMLQGWEQPRADLRPYLRALTRRGLFEGSVFALVDEHGYETTVEQATWWRLAEIVADLAVRARMLHALGVEDAKLADETARFYDSTFLDSPSIGGFL